MITFTQWMENVIFVETNDIDYIWQGLEQKGLRGRLNATDLGILADAMEEEGDPNVENIRWMANNDVSPLTINLSQVSTPYDPPSPRRYAYGWATEDFVPPHGLTPNQSRKKGLQYHQPWVISKEAIVLIAKQPGAVVDYSPTGSQVSDVYFKTIKEAIMAFVNVMKINKKHIPTPYEPKERDWIYDIWNPIKTILYYIKNGIKSKEDLHKIDYYFNTLAIQLSRVPSGHKAPTDYKTGTGRIEDQQKIVRDFLQKFEPFAQQVFAAGWCKGDDICIDIKSIIKNAKRII